MTISKTLFLGVAALSLCACQTTSSIPSPSEALFAGIDSSAIAETSASTVLSTSNPTCLKFYENTATFAALPSAPDVNTGGPSFGKSLMRTVVLGTLAGAVSGGIASAGIGSGFTEAALIGTASQVTYNAGGIVYDKIVSPVPETPAVPEVPALEPMEEIQKAASALGCPAPDTAAIAALKLGEGDK